MNAIKKAVGMLMMVSSLAMAAPADSTEAIWQKHIQDWQNRDLDGIVSDYADDAVVMLVNTKHRGKAEIRVLFAKLFGIFDQAVDHVIDPVTVDGKLVYFTWRTKVKGVAYPFGTDTFFIEEGKIKYQTITSDPKLFE